MSLIKRDRKSAFIHKFENKSNKVFCPSFYILAHGALCPHECVYCYLLNTFGYNPSFEKPVIYTNVWDLIVQVKKWVKKTKEPSVLNMGELSDSLAYDYQTDLTKKIIPLFKNMKHHLLLVTKSINIDNLLETKPNDNIIISYSLNTPKTITLTERKTPKLEKRLKALEKLSDCGYHIRIRIDPLLPIKNWKAGYDDLIIRLSLTDINVERFTLGTLRYKFGVKNKSIIKYGHNEIWDYPVMRDTPDGKLRLENRTNLYKFLGEALSDNYDCDIGICKETKTMRKMLGYFDSDNKCNCTL